MPGGQGRGEGNGPQAHRQTGQDKPGGQTAGFGPEALGLGGEPGRPPLGERPGKEVDSRHGGKGELEGHRRGGVGILEQQEHENGAQRGGLVLLPPQQGRQQKHGLHKDRPQDGGGVAHHRREADQQGDGAHGGAPPPGPQQGGRQPRQEGDVEAGDGDDMGQPRPAEGGIVPVGQPGPVPGKQGGDQGRGLLREGGGHTVLEGLGHIGRPCPQGRPAGAGRLPLPLAVGDQADALGVIIVGRLPRDGIRRPEPGLDGQPIAGPQVGRGGVQIEKGPDRPTFHRVEAHQHRAAVGRGLGPVGHRHLHRPLIPRQSAGGGLEQRAVGRRPQQARGQAKARQKHPPAAVSPEGQPGQRRQGAGHPQGNQNSFWQSMDCQSGCRREGGSKPGQLTHGAERGCRSGPADSRCWCGRAPPA